MSEQKLNVQVSDNRIVYKNYQIVRVLSVDRETEYWKLYDMDIYNILTGKFEYVGIAESEKEAFELADSLNGLRTSEKEVK